MPRFASCCRSSLLLLGLVSLLPACTIPQVFRQARMPDPVPAMHTGAADSLPQEALNMLAEGLEIAATIEERDKRIAIHLHSAELLAANADFVRTREQFAEATALAFGDGSSAQDDRLLLDIVKHQAQHGFFQEAAETISAINGNGARATALAELAFVQTELSRKSAFSPLKEQAEENFRNALSAGERIADDWDRNQTLHHIASKKISLGLEAEALEIAASLRTLHPETYARILADSAAYKIRDGQLSQGQEQLKLARQALAFFDAASTGIHSSVVQEEVSGTIALVSAQAGFIDLALDMVEDIRDEEQRANVLVQIAHTTTNPREVQEILALIQKLAADVTTIDWTRDRIRGILAKGTAKKGSLRGVHATLEAIGSPAERFKDRYETAALLYEHSNHQQEARHLFRATDEQLLPLAEQDLALYVGLWLRGIRHRSRAGLVPDALRNMQDLLARDTGMISFFPPLELLAGLVRTGRAAIAQDLIGNDAPQQTLDAMHCTIGWAQAQKGRTDLGRAALNNIATPELRTKLLLGMVQKTQTPTATLPSPCNST